MNDVNDKKDSGSQQIIDSKMVQLLSKLPQICPKIKKITKTSQPNASDKNRDEGSYKDNSCFICNKVLVMDEDKVVNIHSDMTSRLNNIGNILNTIFKMSRVTWNNSFLCSACFVIIDHYDNLLTELARIEAEMISTLSSSQQEREARFLFGDLTGCKQIWLGQLSVSVTFGSGASQYESQPVDLLSRDLPTVTTADISIPSHFPGIDICLIQTDLAKLCLAISDTDGQPLVPLDQLLQYSPHFSLSPDSKLSVQIQDLTPECSPSDSRKLYCQECHFVTEFFHLLLPHLQTHTQEKDQSENFETYVDVESNGKLYCNECGKVFKKRDVLEAHVKKVHEGLKTPWQCNYCEKSFTRKASLEEHISRHQGVKQRHCEICDKYFYHTAYWRHVTTVHPKKEKLKHTCPHCSKVFSLKFKLDIHLQSHMNHIDKKYSCDECPDKRFASEEKFKNHKRNVHSKLAASHLCGECGASYSNYPALYQHCKRSHNHSTPQAVADQDGTKSVLQRALMYHRNDQPNKKPFLCGFDDCDKGFISIKHLQHHQLINHKGAVEEDDGDNIIYMGDIQDGEDNLQTGIEVTQAVDLRQESMDDSSPNSDPSMEVDGNYARNDSGQLVTAYYNDQEEETFMLTDRDKKRNDDKIERQEFPTNFENIVNIDMNEQNTIVLTEDQGKELIEALKIEIDDDSKLYPCNFCDKTYRNERSRTIHLKSAHMNEKPFQCPVCEKAFACQNYLTEHRKIHFCLDRFRCSLCDKTFSSNKVLKRHFRIHTGEKPFKCEYCEKRFAAASNLSEHRTLHTGRMPYTCTGCGGKFRLWTTLKKHTVKCDGVQPGGIQGKISENGEKGMEEMDSMAQVLVIEGGIQTEATVDNFNLTYQM